MSDQQQQPGANGATTARRARPRFDYGGGAPAAAVATSVALARVPGSAFSALSPGLVAVLLAGLAAFAALFHFNFAALASVWYSNPSWSHGFGIIPLALFLMYLRQDRLKGAALKPSLMGLAILIFGVLSNDLFRVTGQSYLSNLSIVVVLYGGTLFIFGWRIMQAMWLPIGFLTFMINLPQTLYVKVTTPLQFIAAELGVTLLPMIGIDARREGTVIRVPKMGGGEQPLDVEQACSGIRMLIAFVALAVVLAYSTPRPVWQKIFLGCSSVPVAILCNSFRVTLSGWMYVHTPAYAEGAAHAYLGMLMLIPAMGMQLAIGWVLDRVFIEKPDEPVTGAAA